MRAGSALLAVALLAGLAEPAIAAPSKTTCRLVRDATGDVQPDISSKARSGPPSAALDIVGGDIGADTQSLVTVIRLDGQVQADAYSPSGYGYSFRFTIDAGDRPQLFELNADIGAASQNFSLIKYDDNAGYSGMGVYVEGALDNSRHQIRVTAKMSQLQSLAPGSLQHPDGHRLYDFKILSGTSTGEQRVAYVNSMGDDIGESGKATKVGAPSCLLPHS